jgi:hypothetical protein
MAHLTRFHLAGAADGTINGFANDDVQLNVNLSGASDAALNGTTTTTQVALLASGRTNAYIKESQIFCTPKLWAHARFYTLAHPQQKKQVPAALAQSFRNNAVLSALLLSFTVLFLKCRKTCSFILKCPISE